MLGTRTQKPTETPDQTAQQTELQNAAQKPEIEAVNNNHTNGLSNDEKLSIKSFFKIRAEVRRAILAKELKTAKVEMREFLRIQIDTEWRDGRTCSPQLADSTAKRCLESMARAGELVDVLAINPHLTAGTLGNKLRAYMLPAEYNEAIKTKKGAIPWQK